MCPPALKAIQERRDEAERKILNRIAKVYVKTIEIRDPLLEHALDMMTINEKLGEQDRNLKMFDRLLVEGKPTAEVRSRIFHKVLDLLWEAKRYEDIMTEVDVLDWFFTEKYLFKITRDSEKLTKPQRPHSEVLKKQIVIEGSKYYEALLATGRQKTADKLMVKLLVFEESARMHASLIRHAVRARSYLSAKIIAAMAEKTLPEDKLGEVRTAAKSIPEEL